MKKLLLCVCVVAIVALAAMNLNFALNSESKIDLTLAGISSLAENENGWGDGTCKQYVEFMWQNECGPTFAYKCYLGSDYDCWNGMEIFTDNCWPYNSATRALTHGNCAL
jgi:hypothetical protein